MREYGLDSPQADVSLEIVLSRNLYPAIQTIKKDILENGGVHKRSRPETSLSLGARHRFRAILASRSQDVFFYLLPVESIKKVSPPLAMLATGTPSILKTLS